VLGGAGAVVGFLSAGGADGGVAVVADGVGHVDDDVAALGAPGAGGEVAEPGGADFAGEGGGLVVGEESVVGEEGGREASVAVD